MSTQVWEHWDVMVRAARGVLGSYDEAGDCAAEAMAQFLERDPDDVENLEAYLVTISKRRAVDRIRRAERARRREVKVGSQFVLDVRDVADDVVARAEAFWVDREARRLLRPEVYQLVQLVADGVPITEAGRQLGFSQRSAQSHLLRARRVMRAAITRTLIALGVLGVGVRRLLSPRAATVATAAALSTLLAVLPQIGHPDAAAPALRVTPSTRLLWDRLLVVEAPVKAVPRSRPAVHSARRMLPSRPSSVPVSGVGVRSPFIGLGVDTREDNQSNGGLLPRLVACVQNLRIESGYLGCEQQPSSPAAHSPAVAPSAMSGAWRS